jgi:hypothetical protein
MSADLFTADTNWGFNRYDNIFVSFLTIFQALTLGGWRPIVWQISDCFSPMLAVFYWASLMVVGTFFLVKLVLAVMVKTYSERRANHEQEQERAEAEAVFVVVGEMKSGSSSNSGYVTMGQLRRIEKQISEIRKRRRAEMHKLGTLVENQVGTAVNTVNVARHKAEAKLHVGENKDGAIAQTKQKKLTRKEMFLKYGVSKPIHDKLKRVVRVGAAVHRTYPVGIDLFQELMFTTVATSELRGMDEDSSEDDEEEEEEGGDEEQALEEGKNGAKRSMRKRSIKMATDLAVNAVDNALGFLLIQRGELPFYARPALPCLQPVVHHHWFEELFLLLIGANTLVS